MNNINNSVSFFDEKKLILFNRKELDKLDTIEYIIYLVNIESKFEKKNHN